MFCWCFVLFYDGKRLRDRRLQAAKEKNRSCFNECGVVVDGASVALCEGGKNTIACD